MMAETNSDTQVSESLDLRKMIETIPALVVCALPDGSADAVNRAWQEYTGDSVQRPNGWGWQAAVHPDDLAGFVDEWNATLASGKPFAAEARIKRANGEYHWFLMRKTLAVLPTPGGQSSLRALIAFENIDDLKRTEATLRQAETLLRAFFENSPNVIFLKDREGRYLYANRQFERVFGIDGEEIKGKHDFELFSPEQASAFRVNDRLVLEAGAPKEFEEISLQKDGAHTSIVQKFPLFNSEGEIYAIGGIATDITDRKREETARHFSEEKHRLALETASDAIVSVDENSVIQAANPATTRMFGFDSTEMIGQPLTVLMPESLRKMHEKGFKRYLATGQRVLNWQATELTARHKDGHELAVEVSFGELQSEGQRVFTGFIRDITERKRAEVTLKESERALRELTETIPQMLWSAAADGTVRYCNQRVLDYTGLSTEEVHGTGWMSAVHEDDREGIGQAWAAAVRTGEPFQYEFRCLRAADRKYRWCVTSALPLRDRTGDITRWFGSVVDLHDWKEAQQALQMTQMELARVSRFTTMGELAASIAHEVNQPLTAVTNNSSACLRLLANHNLAPDVLRRALEEIVSDGARASAVITRIRSFLKKNPGEKSELNVNEVIQEVLALAGRAFYENRVSLDCALAQSLPLVFADRIQLQQVLLNLIMNGIEAMAADRTRELRVESSTDETGDVLVAIRDSGCGIGSDVDRIFDPFFTTKSNGMGMGLSISRTVINNHGGRLWASPNCPHGTVFWFTLPTDRESAS